MSAAGDGGSYTNSARGLLRYTSMELSEADLECGDTSPFSFKTMGRLVIKRGHVRALQKFAAKNRLVCLIALSIAVLHAAMSITATEEKSPTFDEPGHLTAGYSYWLKNDFR